MRRREVPAAASLTRRRMQGARWRRTRRAGISRCAENPGFSGLFHSLLQQV